MLDGHRQVLAHFSLVSAAIIQALAAAEHRRRPMPLAGLKRSWARAKLTEHPDCWCCWGCNGEVEYGLVTHITFDAHIRRHVLEHISSILDAGGENMGMIA